MLWKDKEFKNFAGNLIQMNTEHFYELILNLDDNWLVKEVKSNIKNKEVDITIDNMHTTTTTCALIGLAPPIGLLVN